AIESAELQQTLQGRYLFRGEPATQLVGFECAPISGRTVRIARSDQPVLAPFERRIHIRKCEQLPVPIESAEAFLHTAHESRMGLDADEEYPLARVGEAEQQI